MKKKHMGALKGALVLTALLALSTAAFADDSSSASSSWWQKTKVNGMFDVNYNYNLDRPSVAPNLGGNSYRLFDANANTFNIGLVKLAIENSPTDWITFHTDLDFGHDADVLRGAETGGLSASNFDLQQAYIKLKAKNIGSGLTFTVGKFSALQGAEVIEAANDSNVSRSFLFSYAIPLTNTGVIGDYVFADWITLDLGVVNGWNNPVDNNQGKTVDGMITLKPYDKVVWTLSGLVGPENIGNDQDIRSLFDTVVTYTPSTMWNFALNYDLGRDGGLNGHTTGFADWQGVAGYINWKPMDTFGLSLRGEYFKDKSGIISAGQSPVAGLGPVNTNLANPGLLNNKLEEATVTAHFYLADGLDLRLEDRYDHSNNYAFLGHSAAKKYQDTLASQIVYSF